MVSVLIQATVWRKVTPESTLEAQKFQYFLGEHPPDPPVASTFPYCQRLKAGRGLGTRLLANASVPTLYHGISCALATPLPSYFSALCDHSMCYEATHDTDTLSPEARYKTTRLTLLAVAG